MSNTGKSANKKRKKEQKRTETRFGIHELTAFMCQTGLWKMCFFFFFGNIFYKIYLKSVKRDATLSTKSIQSDNFQLSKIDLNC